MQKLIKTIKQTASIGKILWLIFMTIALGQLIMTKVFGVLAVDYNWVVDLKWFYAPNFLFDAIQKQGEIGRQSYLFMHFLDYLFITQISLCLSFLTIFLLGKIFKKTKKLDFLCLIPFLYAPMDILENLCVDISIGIFPKKILFLGQIAPYFTLFKSIFLNISQSVVVILLLMLIIKLSIRFAKKILSH